LLQVLSFGLLVALYSLCAVGACDCGPIVCGTLSTNLITKLLGFGGWAPYMGPDPKSCTMNN
jgi:hypothetical protein